MRHRLAVVAVACVLWPAAASAQAPAGAPAAPAAGEGDCADALFNEAKALRDAGQYADACPKFAESRGLANGVGVTLYLADCYEKLGKTQSAWTEFRNAEKLAREKGDKRADVAAAHAQSLEAKLNQVTLIPAPLAAGQAPPSVTVDGAAVPPEQLNAPLAMDPGDHELRIVAPDGSSRVVPFHVDANVAAMSVSLAPPEAPAPPPPAAPPESGAANATVTTVDSGATRRWIGLGLITAAVAEGAIGTWLLTSKVQAMTPQGAPCDTELRPGATPAAVTLFATGGVALVTGIVLVATAARHAPEVAVAPLALPGGGGAFLHGSF